MRTTADERAECLAALDGISSCADDDHLLHRLLLDFAELEAALASDVRDIPDEDCEEAAARIAKLEAERDDKHRMLHEALDRIAELEAKIARYEADLEDPTLSVGEAYAYRSLPDAPGKKDG